MKHIEQNLRQFTWCSNYIEYLDLHKKGLRKQAFSVLKKFFDDFNSQAKSARRDFLDAIYKIDFFKPEPNLYLPYNLWKEILIPEINNWITEEPDNPIPYKWSYDLENLKKSIELDPHDPIALDILSRMIINKISLNQHEIPSGYPYDGNPKDDIELINFCGTIIDNIVDAQKREKIKSALGELKETALKSLNGSK